MCKNFLLLIFYKGYLHNIEFFSELCLHRMSISQPILAMADISGENLSYPCSCCKTASFFLRKINPQVITSPLSACITKTIPSSCSGKSRL